MRRARHRAVELGDPENRGDGDGPEDFGAGSNLGNEAKPFGDEETGHEFGH